jgi:hypothetical protein
MAEAGYKKRKVYCKIYDKHAMLHSQEVRIAGVIALDFFAAAPDEVRRYVIVTNSKRLDVKFFVMM